MLGLAERRARRRAKRAILNPSPLPISDISSHDSDHPQHRRPSHSSQKQTRKHSRSSPAKSRNRATKKRPKPNDTARRHVASESVGTGKENTPIEIHREKPKRSKTKLAPGLALMQNFQANNIARSRITVWLFFICKERTGAYIADFAIAQSTL